MQDHQHEPQPYEEALNTVVVFGSDVLRGWCIFGTTIFFWIALGYGIDRLGFGHAVPDWGVWALLLPAFLLSSELWGLISPRRGS